MTNTLAAAVHQILRSEGPLTKRQLVAALETTDTPITIREFNHVWRTEGLPNVLRIQIEFGVEAIFALGDEPLADRTFT